MAEQPKLLSDDQKADVDKLVARIKSMLTGWPAGIADAALRALTPPSTADGDGRGRALEEAEKAVRAACDIFLRRHDGYILSGPAGIVATAVNAIRSLQSPVPGGDLDLTALTGTTPDRGFAGLPASQHPSTGWREGSAADVPPSAEADLGNRSEPTSWQPIETVPTVGRTLEIRGVMLAHQMRGTKFPIMPKNWRPETPQTEWRLTDWREVEPSSDQQTAASDAGPPDRGAIHDRG